MDDLIKIRLQRIEQNLDIENAIVDIALVMEKSNKQIGSNLEQYKILLPKELFDVSVTLDEQKEILSKAEKLIYSDKIYRNSSMFGLIGKSPATNHISLMSKILVDFYAELEDVALSEALQTIRRAMPYLLNEGKLEESLIEELTSIGLASVLDLLIRDKRQGIFDIADVAAEILLFLR